MYQVKPLKNTLITEPHRYGTVVSEVNLTFDINDKKEVKLVKKESKTVPVKALEADKKNCGNLQTLSREIT